MGETGFAGAEGATAPETFRQTNCQNLGLWRESAAALHRRGTRRKPVIFQVHGQRGHRLDC